MKIEEEHINDIEFAKERGSFTFTAEFKITIGWKFKHIYKKRWLKIRQTKWVKGAFRSQYEQTYSSMMKGEISEKVLEFYIRKNFFLGLAKIFQSKHIQLAGPDGFKKYRFLDVR